MKDVFEILIVILTFLCFLFVYFLPSIIGMDKKHKKGIFVLNIFLGWTVLGWIGAMVWAVSSAKLISTTSDKI